VTVTQQDLQVFEV